ncbi:MAG: hypothetical protein LKF52_08005 [Butyrivibrio sp.]|jgi:hypothetical protein|nr:hypothetical protein [Butyrivibrio sp.]
MKRIKMFGRFAAFLAVSLICIVITEKLLTPKYYYIDKWPTTTTYSDFYKLEKDTADVLFLGSSHSVTAFIPQELYDKYGITSFNMGCEQQSLLLSYYWLQEALKTQKPKVIVLDTYILHTYKGAVGQPLNCTEATIRKSMDSMHWNQNKRRAISDICKADDTQSKLSFYLPNVRFHTRWYGLAENDFTAGQLSSHPGMFGFSAMSNIDGTKFTPLKAGTSGDTEAMVPLMKSYLDKIVLLCRQQNIPLVLVKTPSSAQTIGRHNSTQEYAAENNLPFYDFNMSDLYAAAGYDVPTMNESHLNIWGAIKITDYIGQLLTEQYGLSGHTDAQWSDAENNYQGVKKDCDLVQINEIHDYLSQLLDKRYSIFIVTQGNVTDLADTETAREVQALGFKADLTQMTGKTYFYGVDTPLGNSENMSGESIKYKGSIRSGKSVYTLATASNVSSVQIDGREYVSSGRGIHVVVYDNDREQVVDSVCFTTDSKGKMAAVR